jgi:hypothetical protein
MQAIWAMCRQSMVGTDRLFVDLVVEHGLVDALLADEADLYTEIPRAGDWHDPMRTSYPRGSFPVVTETTTTTTPEHAPTGAGDVGDTEMEVALTPKLKRQASAGVLVWYNRTFGAFSYTIPWI